MLEDALRKRPVRRVTLAGDAFRSHDHHLAGLHIAHIDGIDQIERAGFRGENVRRSAAAEFQLPHRERPEPLRIARHDDPVLRQKDQRKRAFQLQQRFPQSARERFFARVRHQMEDHFGVARCLENGPARFEIGAQFRGIGDVAVVRHRDPALVAMHRKRLGVALHRIAGGRIARMADGERAGQFLKDGVGENIRHVPHRFLGMDQFTVAG